MRKRTALAAAFALVLLLAACGGKEKATVTRADSLEEAKTIASRSGSMIVVDFFSST
ncbi:MAG: hypothetical protein JW958_01510 [Candidatus Eisenbacteria bacterium]|nr:hypothetical protein [Candidatus Eisenbacteria bacterium]